MSSRSMSRSTTLLGLSAVWLSVLLACGGSDSNDKNKNDRKGVFNTADAIFNHLDGKTLTMKGEDIPAFPLGYSEDANFGAATQCYQSVSIGVANRNFTTTSDLGTLEGAPTPGDVGTCNRDVMSNTISFTSTTVLIENVAASGDCFDVTITYPSFKQEGRASLKENGAVLDLELYFEGQASNHRCAAGGVGSEGVTVQNAPLAGSSVQTYRVEAE